MTKWFQIPLALMLAFGAAAARQESGKKDEGCCQEKDGCCGQTFHQLFCGQEKCDNAQCQEACAKAGATLKAVGVRFKELAQKEWGDKSCECCEKSETKPCDKCREFCKTVIVPMVKERMTAHLKDSAREFKHATTGADGKTTEVACTFLKGETCQACVNEIADASFAKLKEKLKDAKKEGCCEGKPKQ